MQMTPKRLRLIAMIMRKGGFSETTKSTLHVADEIDQHAAELEDSQRQVIRLREPGTVFDDLARQSPHFDVGDSQEGRR